MALGVDDRSSSNSGSDDSDGVTGGGNSDDSSVEELPKASVVSSKHIKAKDAMEKSGIMGQGF